MCVRFRVTFTFSSCSTSKPGDSCGRRHSVPKTSLCLTLPLGRFLDPHRTLERTVPAAAAVVAHSGALRVSLSTRNRCLHSAANRSIGPREESGLRHAVVVVARAHVIIGDNNHDLAQSQSHHRHVRSSIAGRSRRYRRPSSNSFEIDTRARGEMSRARGSESRQKEHDARALRATHMYTHAEPSRVLERRINFAQRKHDRPFSQIDTFAATTKMFASAADANQTPRHWPSGCDASDNCCSTLAR